LGGWMAWLDAKKFFWGSPLFRVFWGKVENIFVGIFLLDFFLKIL